MCHMRRRRIHVSAHRAQSTLIIILEPHELSSSSHRAQSTLIKALSSHQRTEEEDIESWPPLLLYRMCSLTQKVYIKCVLSQTLAHLRLEVAVDTRRVDRHFALGCILEEGLSNHLQVGQGRDEYFVLVGVLRLCVCVCVCVCVSNIYTSLCVCMCVYILYAVLKYMYMYCILY